MKGGSEEIVDADTYDVDGDLKVIGKRKIKTKDGKTIYKDLGSEEELNYPKQNV